MNKNIPRHLGVIIDGNRRWARKRNLPTFEGHKKGLNNLKSLIQWSKEKGIKILTMYIFSTENWNRSKKEVDYLMKLFKKVFKKGPEIAKGDIKINIAGERDMVPEEIIKIIQEVEEETKNNKEMIVNFAFSYGGRAEIINAVKKIVKKDIEPEEVTEDLIKNNLYIPQDLDLLIRTSEERVSNFLIWQLAYAEFYFLDKLWPAFSKKDFEEAIKEYQNRKRRYGR